MINVYICADGKLFKQEISDTLLLPENALWVDMVAPDTQEEAAMEAALKLDVPTREDMKGIEFSNRFFKEGDALFMTAALISGTDTDEPVSQPVSFILTQGKLITVRYHDPRAFRIFEERIKRVQEECSSSESVLMHLLETIVDRLSDPLENMAASLDVISRQVFQNQKTKRKKSHDFQRLLRTVGRKGDLNSKVKEALVSLDRLITFLRYNLKDNEKNYANRLALIEQDIRSLTDQAHFISNKINFILEATLGMVNIEQNAIIKFFSVAAVIFLPPTLIASIYGMNFANMPELQWAGGYHMTLVAMLMSAVLPYMYFKYRGWL